MRVCVFGHFNPLEIRHLEELRKARVKADSDEEHGEVVAVVSSDEQLRSSGLKPRMKDLERIATIRMLRYVDRALLSTDSSSTEGFDCTLELL
jgi:glycerol-3-phosphate cytidylyltransferase-like family protein